MALTFRSHLARPDCGLDRRPLQKRVLAGSASPPAVATARLAEQCRSFAKVAGGLAVFLAFDAAIKASMTSTGLVAYLPYQIGSMMGAFATLGAAGLIAPKTTALLHTALLPGVAWVSRWLVVFLVPVQVMLPTLSFPGGVEEALKLAFLLGTGWFAALFFAARLATALQAALPAVSPAAAAPAAAAITRTWRLPAAWLLLASGSFGAGASGDEDLDRGLRGLSLASLGIGSFALAARLGLQGHICFLACGAATICGASALAAVRGEAYGTVVKRDYLAGVGSMQPGSGDWLLWCLSPALVATGVQMFQFRARIAALSGVLLGSCVIASLANIVGTAALGSALGLSPIVLLASTMRCVTIPMALPTYSFLCKESGMEGDLALVALCAGVTGFVGFSFSRPLLSSVLFAVPEAFAVTRGLATGASAHALGSATLAACEPEAFVWGMLAMATCGVASALWICACPPVRDLVLSLALPAAAQAEEQT